MTTTVDYPQPVADIDRLAELNSKLDRLTESVAALGQQVEFLGEKAYEDRRRQREWDELREDLTPVINDVYAVTVEQLEEIQAYVQLEDVAQLAKRLARNTRTFNELLDQVESVNDFVKDFAPLSADMLEQSILMLNEMEQKGYFGFVRQGQYVMDQIVTSFSEDDVRLLGDNVVLILNTVKALTQPQMMDLVNNLTSGFQEVEGGTDELPTSLFGLMREMRDPEVRRGLAITMQVLKKISAQYQ